MNTADRIERDAIRWVLRIEASELSARQLKRLNRWLKVREHQEEFAKIMAVHQRARSLRGAPRPHPRSARVSAPFWQRKSTWKVGAPTFGVLAVITLGTIGYRQIDRPSTHTYTTHVGEIKDYELDDGSLMWLNTDSQIEVRFTKTQRELLVPRGEFRFQVKKDPDRPFLVKVGNTEVRAVGTDFSVRRLREKAERVEVFVSEGKIAVDTEKPSPPAAQKGQTETATAGERVVVDAEGVRKEKLSPDELERLMSWQKERITFTGQTVAEGVKEFNRYHSIKLVIADENVATRPLGGTFSVSDVDGFVGALINTFGLRRDPANTDASEIRLIAANRQN